MAFGIKGGYVVQVDLQLLLIHLGVYPRVCKQKKRARRRVLGNKLFNLNSVKRHLILVAQPVRRVKFTWGSQLPGSEALWEFLI